MKYILLLISASSFSLEAMQKPPAKPKEVPADEQVQEIHVKVKAVREQQTHDINLIAARIDAEFYTNAANYENPSASILDAHQQKAPSFTLEVEAILDERIKRHAQEMHDLLRRLTECQTELGDLEKKKLRRKKSFTQYDSLLEKAQLITAEQSVHEILKKAAELTHFLSVLHDRKEKGYDKKNLIDQGDN
jgi:hypothetical protein